MAMSKHASKKTPKIQHQLNAVKSKKAPLRMNEPKPKKNKPWPGSVMDNISTGRGNEVASGNY